MELRIVGIFHFLSRMLLLTSAYSSIGKVIFYDIKNRGKVHCQMKNGTGLQRPEVYGIIWSTAPVRAR